MEKKKEFKAGDCVLVTIMAKELPGIVLESRKAHSMATAFNIKIKVAYFDNNKVYHEKWVPSALLTII